MSSYMRPRDIGKDQGWVLIGKDQGWVLIGMIKKLMSAC